MDVIAEFRACMAGHGLHTTETIIPTRKVRRFNVTGDPKTKRNGWYQLFVDGVPNGVFGCNKRGFQAKWKAEGITLETPINQAEIEAKNKAKKEEERIIHDKTAIKANKIWNGAKPASPTHPYAVNKQVRVDGLREGYWHKTGIAGCLLVPIYAIMSDRPKLVNLQAIFPRMDETLGRNKDFLAGGRKQGCYHPIGAKTDTIVICEGWATGMSIHMATGLGVAVAFDAGNLPHVTKVLKERHRDTRFVIGADNDATGIKYAGQCGADVIVCPVEKWDFNDLHVAHGLDAVGQCFNDKK